MHRRRILIAIAAGALGCPINVFGQRQGRVRRIGVLWENPNTARLEAFKSGLRELAYVEGKDYVVEQRSAHGDAARLPALAAELLAWKAEIIISTGTPSAQAARQITRDIPILITTAGDPVGSGLVASLSRPGGNITGVTGISTQLLTKRLDLLRQLLPGLRRVGFLYNPDTETLGLKRFESDCSNLQLTPIRAPARKGEEFAIAFKMLQESRVQGLVVSGASSNGVARQSIVEHAAKHQLPTMYPSALWTDLGGLVSYGVDNVDLYRRAAAYADKIWKGAKPAELPIEQPTKFEFVFNRKTADVLGIKPPEQLLFRADRVIE